MWKLYRSEVVLEGDLILKSRDQGASVDNISGLLELHRSSKGRNLKAWREIRDEESARLK